MAWTQRGQYNGVEWVRAQVEAYLKDMEDPSDRFMCEVTLGWFMKYIEEKFQPR